MELLPHQVKAVKNLGNGKILWGGVGTGKSLTVLHYYVQNESPRDIYVITTAKKRDTLEWEREAARLTISTVRAFSAHGKITIDSWNNIKNYVNIEDAFFIFDEQRLVGNGVWVKSFQKIAKKNRWVMLSATPGDTWLDYVPVFIANGLYRNPTEFKREHVIYKPYSRYPIIDKYIGISTLEKYRNMLLVEMPYLRHTTRVLKDVPVDYDTELYKLVVNRRWHPYENRPLNNVSELFHISRRVAYADPSRLREIKKILKDHPKVIIFYNFDYELEILRTLSEITTVGELNGHRKTPIPSTDSWVYLVQYVSGAEAWNCTETDTMVFYSLTYSYRNFEQAQGRIDRLDTPFSTLFYYILLSNSAIDRAVRKSLDKKELFNERKYAKEFMNLDEDFLKVR